MPLQPLVSRKPAFTDPFLSRCCCCCCRRRCFACAAQSPRMLPAGHSCEQLSSLPASPSNRGEWLLRIWGSAKRGTC